MRRGVRTKVDRDIDKPTGEAADELPLGSRRRLEVNSTNGPGAHAERLIVLDELRLACLLQERVQFKYFGEIAPLILDPTRNYFERSIDFEPMKLHNYP
jgi:hypothetical protein